MAKMTVHDMVRGLVRAAEFREQESCWDDQCQDALAAARERGWGKNRVGSLDDPPEAIAEFLKDSPAISPEFRTALKMFPSMLENMVGLLVQQAVAKLPREKKIEAIKYIAELVWPGSTK